MKTLLLDKIPNKNFKQYVTNWDNLLKIDLIFTHEFENNINFGFKSIDGAYYAWYNDENCLSVSKNGLKFVEKFANFDFCGE